MEIHPPKRALKFLRWFCREDFLEEIEGDLIEVFEKQHKVSPSRARRKFRWSVIRHFRPEFIKTFTIGQNSIQLAMLKNYFKTSYRSLLRNKGYSFINISGLTLGMAVAMMIGLWVNHELSYNTYHENYDRIAQVMRNKTNNGIIYTSHSQARPLEFILREEFGDSFEHIIMGGWLTDHVLSHDHVTLTQEGNYLQESAPQMLGLDMLSGVINGLDEPNKIMLSRSTAIALFGAKDPIGEIIRMDNSYDLIVSGIYADLPVNTTFGPTQFIVPWSLLVSSKENVRADETEWNTLYQIFIQLADHADIQAVNDKIRRIPSEKDEDEAESNTEIFLHPMKDWHLRSNWKNGIQAGGRIQYVILFSIIGAFVLFLACINFMNLSTARSQRRAKEVGIRKSIGSHRGQLIGQFLNESFFVVIIAFLLAVGIIVVFLPQFNSFMKIRVDFPWDSLAFWIISVAFVLVTSLLAGSYPAFYLSSFRPIQALKGSFKAGKGAGLSRRILVVVQFAVSITLVICTLFIFRQVQHGKQRPTGYEREGLIQVRIQQDAFKNKYDLFKNAFLQSGAVLEMSGTHSPLTDVWWGSSGLTWEGMPTNFRSNFDRIRVSHDYGSSIQWEIVRGRDFSRDIASDSLAVIINESAAAYMGMEDPLGKTIDANGTRWRTIIGVVKDMVMQSPYQTVHQTLYTIGGGFNFYTLRLNPANSTQENLARLEKVFKSIMPQVPFNFEFVDEAYAQKFRGEERVGSLAWVFTGLAIFISCLGLFGLSSFMVEQRLKEIGIRKVLGASVLSLWRLLVKDFVTLVVIACFIAVPLAFYFVNDWGQQFEYRIALPWWVILAAATAALSITLFTVSYQTLRAVNITPTECLKDE